MYSAHGLLRVTVLVALLALAVAQNQPCLGKCTGNLDCSPLSPCKWCINNQCGVGCSQKCNVTADCLDTNCNGCINGTCQHQGAHNVTCGGACTADEQCETETCSLCIHGKCAAGCSMSCKMSSQCGDSNCNGCVNGTCQHVDPHNVTCGGMCKSDAECELTGCSLCINGKCGAGCNMACSESSQCGDSNCFACVNMTCQHADPHNVTCGGVCTYDGDCQAQGACNLCLNNKCGSGCGGECSADSQCLDPNCNGCVEGKCQHKDPHNVPCGGACQTDGECETTSCTLCLAGKCGAGCNGTCTADTQCGDTNCMHCVKGFCLH